MRESDNLQIGSRIIGRTITRNANDNDPTVKSRLEYILSALQRDSDCARAIGGGDGSRALQAARTFLGNNRIADYTDSATGQLAGFVAVYGEQRGGQGVAINRYYWNDSGIVPGSDILGNGSGLVLGSAQGQVAVLLHEMMHATGVALRDKDNAGLGAINTSMVVMNCLGTIRGAGPNK